MRREQFINCKQIHDSVMRTGNDGNSSNSRV